MPENLPAAWKDEQATSLGILTALSQQTGLRLPWKTVRDAIAGAIQARFVELSKGKEHWPCDLAGAESIKIAVTKGERPREYEGDGKTTGVEFAADLEPENIQDLAEIVPDLLAIKARTNLPIHFRVRIRIGDDGIQPPPEDVEAVREALKRAGDNW